MLRRTKIKIFFQLFIFKKTIFFWSDRRRVLWNRLFYREYVDENLPTVSLLAKKMPIFYLKKDTPEVCLTFDMSWGGKALPLVLQLLAELFRVPVTFFF